MYKCINFGIYELVDPDTYNELGEDAWRIFNPVFLQDLDVIRDHVYRLAGYKLIINDYFWGGNYTDSGLRSEDSVHYRKWSGHSWGQAFDIKLDAWVRGEQTEYDADWLRGEIIQLKKDGMLEALSEVEMMTDRYVHIGCRNQEPNFQDILFVFEP